MTLSGPTQTESLTKEQIVNEELEDDGVAEEETGDLAGAPFSKRFPSPFNSHSPADVGGDGKKKKKKKKPKKKKLEQTDPPRVGISKFFPDGVYPEGEIQPYKD
jgi:hypothetical protein